MSHPILAKQVANIATTKTVHARKYLIDSLFENREITVYQNLVNPWPITEDTHHASILLYLVRALSMLR